MRISRKKFRTFFLRYLYLGLDWRASLNVDTLEALMHISMNGCEFQEYDAARAVQRWLTSGERLKRPEFLD